MADVGVAPIEYGTGTRLKILEYFAAGLPVVSTTIGALGLEASDGREILIADDYELFSSHIIALLRDASMREKLGRDSRELVRRKYCRDIVVNKLASILEAAVP